MRRLQFVAFLHLLTLISVSKGWRSESNIPAEEDESCPDGKSIPCNTVIDVNNTVLRYERGNLTYGSSSIPSQLCPWKIRGPPGTSIILRTTCYHHFHVSNLTEYAVCFHVKPVYDQFIVSSKDCGAGYWALMSMPPNEVDLSVYYQEGHKYALGFTMEIIFVDKPITRDVMVPALMKPTTEPSIESTTSNAFYFGIEGTFLWAFAAISVFLTDNPTL